MTTKDLKDNRNEIIATITEKVGENNVVSVMQIMIVNVAGCDSIEECIDMAIDIFEFQKYAKKDSKLVAMHNAAHVNEKYNIITKDFEKE